MDVVGALMNGVFLLALCFTLIIEAIQRLVEPAHVANPLLVLIVGCVGLANNCIGMFMFHGNGFVKACQLNWLQITDTLTDTLTHSHEHTHLDEHAHEHGHDHHHDVHHDDHDDHRNNETEKSQNILEAKDEKKKDDIDVTQRLVKEGARLAVGKEQCMEFLSSTTVNLETGAGIGHSKQSSNSSYLISDSNDSRNAVNVSMSRSPSQQNHDDGSRSSFSNILSNPTVMYSAQNRAAVLATAKTLSRRVSADNLHVHGGDLISEKTNLELGKKALCHDDHHDHIDNEKDAKAVVRVKDDVELGLINGKKNGERKPREGDLNMRSIFLHVAGDALGSVGVVVAAVAMMKYYVDPIISLFITAIILSSTIPLVRSASFILLQVAPVSVPIEKLTREIKEVNGVIDVHDFHVWGLSDSKSVASVHILMSEKSYRSNNDMPKKKATRRNVNETASDHREDLPPSYMDIAAEVKVLLHRYGVHSTTVQPEFIRCRQTSQVQDGGNADAIQQDTNDSGVNSSEPATSGCMLKCPEAACIQESCCPSQK
ncbi:hypothetical protein HDU97_006219 [Phlyctochytrium planicorne]|nr:hypothetical protein HDU97_006219 [Phlyctochytrium planicorne]